MGIFEARIEKLINGGIIITDPDFVRGDSELSEGAVITVQYTQAGSIYQFDSSIKSISIDGGTQVILSPARNIRKVQRRMFVRLGLHHDISYAIVAPDMSWIDWEDELKWHSAITYDISGSGMLLEKTSKISLNDILLLRLPFFREVGIVDPVAVVCRRISEYDENNLIGVEFILDRDLQEFFDKATISLLPRSVVKFDLLQQMKLSHYVFGKQISSRKEGH